MVYAWRGMMLQGRVALVTGGGRGIGRAVARRLASDGARVVVTGRKVEDLELVAADTGGLAVAADLASRDSIRSLLQQIEAQAGHVDILVNNAGVAVSAPLSRVTDEVWDQTLAINATAPFLLCRALIPAMVQAGWGRVINIASNAGLTGYGYSSSYCASKHALVGFTRALAVDLGSSGVTINAVCPGWVDTDMAADAVARIAEKTGRGIQRRAR